MDGNAAFQAPAFAAWQHSLLSGARPAMPDDALQDMYFCGGFQGASLP